MRKHRGVLRAVPGHIFPISPSFSSLSHPAGPHPAGGRPAQPWPGLWPSTPGWSWSSRPSRWGRTTRPRPSSARTPSARSRPGPGRLLPSISAVRIIPISYLQISQGNKHARNSVIPVILIRTQCDLSQKDGADNVFFLNESLYLRGWGAGTPWLLNAGVLTPNAPPYSKLSQREHLEK